MYMKNCLVLLLSYCVGVLCKELLSTEDSCGIVGPWAAEINYHQLTRLARCPLFHKQNRDLRDVDLVNTSSKAQARISCDLEDSKCTTSSVNPIYQLFINGVPELGIPPSDPIHQDVIFGYQGDLNYTLTDAYKYGWKDCAVTEHRLFPKNHTWSFTLHCPLLFMRTNYEVIGFIAGNYIEGKGLCHVTDKQYHMVVRGGFEFFNGVDGKSYMRVTNYDFERLEVLGNVKYEFHNLYYGDEVRSQQMHTFLNENWKAVSTATQYPAMYAFMGKLLERLNLFLLTVPADEIFYQNY